MKSVKDTREEFCWGYGPNYDLAALDELTEVEKSVVAESLISYQDKTPDDLDALIRIGSPACISAIETISRSSGRLMRLIAAEYLSSIGRYDDLVGEVCRILEGDAYTDVFFLIKRIAPRLRSNRIERAMLRAAWRSPTEDRAKWFMDTLCKLRGYAPERFDWDKCPFFLWRFMDRRERHRNAIHNICRKIGIDLRACLQEPIVAKSQSKAHDR